MLEELGKLQSDLPRDARHLTSPPTTTRLPGGTTVPGGVVGRGPRGHQR